MLLFIVVLLFLLLILLCAKPSAVVVVFRIFCCYYNCCCYCGAANDVFVVAVALVGFAIAAIKWHSQLLCCGCCCFLGTFFDWWHSTYSFTLLCRHVLNALRVLLDVCVCVLGQHLSAVGGMSLGNYDLW